jgi:bZIP transcription factor
VIHLLRLNMSTISDQHKRKLEDVDAPAGSVEPDSKTAKTEDGLRLLKRGPISKAREIRLEQNRKAARQSRRRKKVMIEELQRSVIFFSRSNGVLKQQNDDLQRLVMNARSQVSQIEGQKSLTPVAQSMVQVKEENHKQQAEANAVATQAVLESQGFPSAAARAVAQTMNGTSASDRAAAGSSHGLPPMQPGATMQAMANFQQAAAVAMQQAVQGMKQIPGITVSALTATAPSGANPSQAFNDTMTALAMQQAAAAAGHPGFFQQGGFMPRMPWQQGQARMTQLPSSAQP